MFSIRVRFILIYFLLIMIAMSVVGVFIIFQLKQTQLEMNSKNMTSRIESIIESTDILKYKNWNEDIDKIQNSIEKIQIGYDENIYVILNNAAKTVIAGSVEESIGESAYNINNINNYIMIKSVNGKKSEIEPKNQYEGSIDNVRYYHISYPIYAEGSIKGYIYLTNNINFIYETVNISRNIMTQATIIALSLTVFLGLILASTITGPIKDLTRKAKEMSKGNFNQRVDVKSTDEIGKLGNMFNLLTEELRNTLSNLEKEKSKMQTTLEYMADGVLTVDKDGEIIHANPIARKIISFDGVEGNYDQIIGKINCNDNISLKILKNKQFQGNSILEQNEEVYKIDFAPFKDNRNEIGGVVLVFKNITEQYKLEKLQREFVANVSHELKTPITTIKSYAETLLDGALTELDLAKDFLNVINSESDRMARLVSDLLQLSKMDYSKVNWMKEKINIKEKIKEIYKKLIIQAKAKHIDFVLEDMPADANVMFDKDSFEQMILNIAGNAIKYTPENGKVSIDVTRKDDNIVVNIRDNGIGIPKEDQLRIFERFYRVDKARTRQLGGTGLGLSIAKQIAEEHNGIIEVESEIEKGTLVKIIIPELL